MRPSSPTTGLKRISAASALAIFASALNILPAAAQTTSYTDVPSGVYYESAASALLELGALDRTESRLRPADLATRAELVKLLVNLKQETLLYPTPSHFSDVSRSAWYFPYFEAAANVGWVHGDGNCYPNKTPCTARPGSRVNRAEAATLLVRAFALEATNAAPDFPDNSPNEWYYPMIKTAADHCILQGDGQTGLVRPGSDMNRAEMIVMFHRAYAHLMYGTDCGTSSARVTNVSMQSATKLRVTFSDPLVAARATDTSRFTVMKVGDRTTTEILGSTVVDSRTVDLTLRNSLTANAAYQVRVNGLQTTGGMVFTDTYNFTSASATAVDILAVTALSSKRVRVTFDGDIDVVSSGQLNHYTLTRPSDGSNVTVTDVTRVDSRTLELTLTSDLAVNGSYRLDIQNLLGGNGVTFSDFGTFTYPNASTAGRITAVSTPVTGKIRVTFNADLDRTRAEDKSRYVLIRNGSGGQIAVSSAVMVDSRTVDLTIGNNLALNAVYRLDATNLMLANGTVFSDYNLFSYPPSQSGNGTITSVSAVSATKLRLMFDASLDRTRAQDTLRYTVTEGTRAFNVQIATLLTDDRTVELTLSEALTTTHAYNVSAKNLLTSGGVLFDANGSTVYNSGTTSFNTTLAGSSEVPPVTTVASGSGTFTLGPSGLAYDITVKNLTGAVTAAHFHLGAAGTNGAVLMPITFSGNRAVGVWGSGSITADQRMALFASGIYVNVHTAARPDGEIRGQVIPQ